MSDDARVTVYGPNVTLERTAAVRAIVDALGTLAELFAAKTASGSAVLIGSVDDIAPLVAPGGLLSFDDTRPFGLSVARREHVARKLEALGRRDDAAKVRGGPPEPPPFDSSALLVVVLADVVAVTWSQIRPEMFGVMEGA